MIISCLLLKTSQLDPEQALDLFAKKRTSTNKDTHVKEQRVTSNNWLGVSSIGPSQNRYVFYYWYTLENGMPPPKPLKITGIVVPVWV